MIATTVEQSLELMQSLKIDTADMHYVRKTKDFRGNEVESEWAFPKFGNPHSKHANYIVQNFAEYEVIPAWSLGALSNLMPKEIKYKGFTYNLGTDLKTYIWYSSGDYGAIPLNLIWIRGDNILDLFYKMVIWLIQKHLITDYEKINEKN